MKKTKLTLRLSDSVIATAKQYAAESGVSLSQLTESLYLDYMHGETDPSGFSSGSSPVSLAEKYSGFLQGETIDEEKEITNYLIDKHSK